MRKRIHFFALLAIAFLGMMTLSACSSGGGGSHPTVNDLVVVPGSSSVPVSQTAQFTAFLNGASTSVTWPASAGTIDGTGVFTAPTAPGSVTITATSGSNTGTTTVNVVASTLNLGADLSIGNQTVNVETGATVKVCVTGDAAE